MRKLKTRITIMMIASSVCICILFMLVTNISANKYIDSEAKKALEENDINQENAKSIDMTNSINIVNGMAITDDVKIEDIAKEVNEIIITGESEKIKLINNVGIISKNVGFEASSEVIPIMTETSDKLFDVRYFFYSKENISEQYQTKYLSYDDQNIYELLKSNKIVEDDTALYSINDRDYYAKILKFKNDGSGDEKRLYSQNIVIYVPITSIKNIVDNINTIFVILTLITILVFGFAGLKSGEYIENSQRKMKHFFENASHELKTPLMSIQGYAEGVKTNIIDVDEGVNTILRQSDKMQVLIDEILNLSKIDSGQLVLNENEINLYYLISDIIDDLADIITLDVSVENFISKDIPIIVGDEIQISKAFKTMIYNGIKFADSKVIIKSRRDKNKIYIIIEDDGKGINKEDLPHIFDRFYSKNNLSNGIGLAMAREIFKLTGGNIEAISGDFGIFIVELPIAK